MQLCCRWHSCKCYPLELTLCRSHRTPVVSGGAPFRMVARKEPEAPPMSRMRLYCAHLWSSTKAWAPAIQARPICLMSQDTPLQALKSHS